MLAQDRNPGTSTERKHRCSDVFCRIKAQFEEQSRVIFIREGSEGLVGTLRVVAQTRNLVAGLRPHRHQLAAPGMEDLLGVTPEAQFALVVGFPNEVIGQPRIAHGRGHPGPIFTANLNHGTQFFSKQTRKQFVAHPALDGVRLFLQTVHIIHVGVVAHRIEQHRQPTLRCKGHLAQSGKQTAVAAIVIRQQQPLGAQLLNDFEETLQHRRIHIGRMLTDRTIHLRESGATQPVTAAPEVDQQQLGLDAFRKLQLRREGCTDIGHRSKRRHHQRQGRDHLAFAAPLLPAGPHRKRVLAHRNRQPGLLTKRRHGGDGIKQPGVLTAMASGCHPVGRQLHILDRAHRSRGEVGDRFPNCHPP